MSEPKRDFMEELDLWSEATIIGPLVQAEADQNWESTVQQVKKAIRTKVLDSYHNGKKAGAPRYQPRAK